MFGFSSSGVALRAVIGSVVVAGAVSTGVGQTEVCTGPAARFEITESYPRFELAASDEAVFVYGHEEGAVDVFARQADEWVFRQRLVDDDDSFPRPVSVAADGDTVAYIDRHGRLWIFEGVPGDLRFHQLIPAPVAGGSTQHMSIVFADGAMFVSRPITVTEQGLEGVVHVYEKVGGKWSREQELLAGEGGLFGRMVFGGASTFVAQGPSQLHVFRRDADGLWALDALIDDISGFPGSRNAALDDLIVLPGPPLRVYARDADGSWSLVDSIDIPESTMDSQVTAAIQGEAIVAGVVHPLPDDAADDELRDGVVHVFDRMGSGQWALADTVEPPYGTEEFGFRMQSAGLSVLVGAVTPYPQGFPDRGHVVEIRGAGGADVNQNGRADRCDLDQCSALDADEDGVLDVEQLVDPPVFVVVDGGRWSEGATWSTGVAPDAMATVQVLRRVVVDDTSAAAGIVQIACGGVVELAQGELRASVIRVMDGGCVRGEGTLIGDIDNRGRVEPGSGIGVLAIDGMFAQGDTGRLVMEISEADRGFEFDQLDVSGTARLGGVLEVAHPTRSSPTVGDVYPLIESDMPLGRFIIVDRVLDRSSPELDIRYTPGGVDVAFRDRESIDACDETTLEMRERRAFAIERDVAIIGRDIYRRVDDHWSVVQTLGVEVPQNAAVSGDWIALSINEDLGDDLPLSGAVYMYRWSADDRMWLLQQRLEHPEPRPLDFFGWGLALDGSTLAVGAPYGPDGIDNAALTDMTTTSNDVVVYRELNGQWTLEERIRPPHLRDGDFFGSRLSLSGARLGIGGLRRAAGLPQPPGSAWLYQRAASGWTLDRQFTDPRPQDTYDHPYYGFEIEVDGDVVALFSATKADVGFTRRAEVFRHRSGQWVREADISASSGPVFWTSPLFSAVALDGDTIVLAGPTDVGSGDGYDTMISVFEFHDAAWNQRDERIYPGDSLASFASNVRMHAGRAVIQHGTSITFATGLGGADCNRNGVADVCDILSGEEADVDDNGVPDDCPTTCRGDCSPVHPDGSSGNGIVGIDDLLLVIGTFGSGGQHACDVAPMNDDGTFGDGIVNIEDLFAVIEAFGPCE